MRLFPLADALALDAAEALCQWHAAYGAGVRGRRLRRMRLTYYDLRWELEARTDFRIACAFIERALWSTESDDLSECKQHEAA